MDDHVLSPGWVQPMPLSDVDTIFVKVALRSPSLIFLFFGGGEVASAFVEKVFIQIFGRGRLFWAMLTFKSWLYVTIMCLSDPVQQLRSRAHPSYLFCCSFGDIEISLTPWPFWWRAVHSHVANVAISTEQLLAIRPTQQSPKPRRESLQNL